MKLSELYTTRDVEVTFPGGKTLNVTYAANELTPKVETELREASNAQQMAALVQLLVKSWDLEENDGGGSVPLTEERLQTVPLVVLSIVIRAVTQDITESTRAEGNS
jgi:hypothetical protein